MHSFCKLLLLIVVKISISYCFNCVLQGNKVMESELTTPNEWILESIQTHNAYRALHGAAPLKFNATLCRSAQWTADKILKIGFMHTRRMPGGFTVKCGENLFSSVGKLRLSLGYEPVESWYSEEPDYNYATGKTKVIGRAIGHFTQLVWKSSQEVCIAYATDGRKFYAAAHYYPTGNVKRRYFENVGQPAETKPGHLHLNPLVELFCKKSIGKGKSLKKYRCKLIDLLQLLPNGRSVSLKQVENTTNLMDVVLEQKSISAFVVKDFK